MDIFKAVEIINATSLFVVQNRVYSSVLSIILCNSKDTIGYIIYQLEALLFRTTLQFLFLIV